MYLPILPRRKFQSPLDCLRLGNVNFCVSRIFTNLL